MKADFEKGTKICSRCKKELPIKMFSKNKNASDGLFCLCKCCNKDYKYEKECTFKGKLKIKRGCSNIVKRDYELTEEQLKRRNTVRKHNNFNPNVNPHGILVWCDEKLNELDDELYRKMYNIEYSRQRRCAIRGYIGRVEPSKNLLFDFDLEQMLKDNVYIQTHGKKKYITKWWKGNIRHWTVKDGIWKE